MQGYYVDETAFDLAASDISGPIRIPIQTTADGYYLPRCGSMFAFGNEKTKICTRIIMKLALNEQLYLDNENLQRGTNLERHFSHMYAMFSNFYIPGIHITDSVIAFIYEAEVLKCTKQGSYMGIWQLFALADVLKCPVMSSYPMFVRAEIREGLDLHRLILPSHNSEGDAKAHILWTSTRSDMKPQNWIPNHFVPLVCIDRDDSIISKDPRNAHSGLTSGMPEDVRYYKITYINTNLSISWVT
jgi:hypothetical protein